MAVMNNDNEVIIYDVKDTRYNKSGPEPEFGPGNYVRKLSDPQFRPVLLGTMYLIQLQEISGGTNPRLTERFAVVDNDDMYILDRYKMPFIDDGIKIKHEYRSIFADRPGEYTVTPIEMPKYIKERIGGAYQTLLNKVRKLKT